MSLRILVGSVVFSNTLRSGFLVGQAGLKGWHSGVTVRRDLKDRPLAAGSFDQPGYLDARMITVSGFCFADSLQKLRWYQSQLTGLLAAGDATKLVVVEDGETWWCNVRQTGQPEFDMLNDGLTATYQAQFWAADPRKYGETPNVFTADPATPLVVRASHYGNYPAYPILTISGSMPSYSVSSGGKTFQVSKPVTAGHPHSIYMDSGLLLVDGSPVYGAVVQGSTWSVPPGTFVDQTLAPAGGNGAMTVTVPDTSI